MWATAADCAVFSVDKPSPIDPYQSLLDSLPAAERPAMTERISGLVDGAAQDGELSRFIIAPEALEEMDREIMDQISGYISDREAAASLRERAGDSGRKALTLLRDDARRLADVQGARRSRPS